MTATIDQGLVQDVRHASRSAWFDRPVVLAVGTLLSVGAFSVSVHGAVAGVDLVREAGRLLLLCLAVPGLVWWRTSLFRVAAAFWSVAVLSLFVVTGAFGGSAFWWPLVMVPFVAVGYVRPNPIASRRGWLVTVGSLGLAAICVTTVTATTPRAAIAVLAEDPGMQVRPRQGSLASSSDHVTCRDSFDGRQPYLVRSYENLSSAAVAVAEMSAALVSLGWREEASGSHRFVSRVGGARAVVAIGAVDRAVTITGTIPDVDYC